MKRFGTSMRRAVLGAALVLVAGALPAPAEPLTIEGAGLGRDVVCAGEDVGVYGAQNVVSLTGQCGRVTVVGSGHRVTFEKATELAVSGADNTVRGGDAGRVVVDVSQNVVEAVLRPRGGDGAARILGSDQQVKLTFAGASTLSVQGADNKVEWSAAQGAPKPRVSIGGAGNKVVERK